MVTTVNELNNDIAMEDEDDDEGDEGDNLDDIEPSDLDLEDTCPPSCEHMQCWLLETV